jgi:uncharacterized membrane protein
LYGLATAAAGVMDLVWGDFDPSHQPIQAFGDHIPGRELFAYIVGVWMIAGGLAILWRRTAKGGAAALAAVYLVFTIFWLPRFYTAPHFLGVRLPVYIGVMGGFGSQLIVVAAGALVYVYLSTQSSSWPQTVLVSSWIFGLCSISFGLGHLAGIEDNTMYVPKWMPLGGEFWVIVTGICFMLAGVAILTGILDVLSARMLALMLFVFSAVRLMPMMFVFPHRHDVWGGNAYNLAAVAAAWILAESIAARNVEQGHGAKPRLAEVA